MDSGIFLKTQIKQSTKNLHSYFETDTTLFNLSNLKHLRYSPKILSTIQFLSEILKLMKQLNPDEIKLGKSVAQELV